MSVAMPVAETMPPVDAASPHAEPSHRQSPHGPSYHAAEAADDYVASNGRLRCGSLNQADRNYSVAMHLSLFASMLIFPPLGCAISVIMWLVRRNRSGFVYDQGCELANVVITGLIATLVLGLIPIIGWLALLAWYIVIAINAVRGAIAASRSEYFRYPMTFRLLS